METHADLTKRILGAAIEVHKVLGPGLLENSYRTCLVHQFSLEGLLAEQEKPVEVEYKGMVVPTAYRADIVVENTILMELKSVERLLPIHDAQVLTYLKHTGLHVGLLLNFNTSRLALGIRRFIR